MPDPEYAGKLRGVISRMIRRHRNSVAMKMTKASAAYIKELEYAIYQASRYLSLHSDPALEAEVETGKEYLSRNSS
jgi:hypothetical protein